MKMFRGNYGGQADFGENYSLENSHKPFAFNRSVAAIFMVRL
jgi:hypothetical protein